MGATAEGMPGETDKGCSLTSALRGEERATRVFHNSSLRNLQRQGFFVFSLVTDNLRSATKKGFSPEPQAGHARKPMHRQITVSELEAPSPP